MTALARGLRQQRGWMLPLALLPVLALLGCASEKEQYCEAVTEQQEGLTEALAGDPRVAFFRALPGFQELEGEAPRDIRDEWDTLIEAIEELEAALDDAGVDPAAYDPKKLPEGLSAEERDEIASAADTLASPEVAAALAAVEQQVRDVCQTPLTL